MLLLMDAFGLRPRIEEMADRIAAEGYTVLAPNVFYRAGRNPIPEMPDMSNQAKRAEAFGKLRPLMDALTPAAVESDGRAYLRYLETAAPGPAAISGYCMGGRLGFQIAADHAERVAALGAFHAGRLVTDAPDSPHLRAPEVKAEVVFGYADNDQSATPEQIEAMNDALDCAGVRHTTEVYEGAAHGYTMSDTTAWDEAACERHFRALFRLLARTFPR